MELLKTLVLDRFTDELVGIGATALTLYVSDISSLITPTSGFPGSNPTVAALSIGPASLDTVKLENVKPLNSHFLHRNFWAWDSVVPPVYSQALELLHTVLQNRSQDAY
jgi:hypothetical protein